MTRIRRLREKRLLTKYAHQVSAFTDLMMKCLVATVEESLLLAEYLRGTAMHGVDDVLKGVQALEWDPL